jgi:hypothetical protein
MFTEPVSTEIVCQVACQDQRQLLQKHFSTMFRVYSEARLVPSAAFETDNGMERFLSGVASPFFNGVIGCPLANDWDKRIDEQLAYFNKANVPFVWYLDEESSPEFKQKLIERGFQDGGIFRGVIGSLDKPIPNPEVSDDYILESVQDEATMDEFNELVCSTFGVQGVNKELYKKILWNGTKSKQRPMFHWIARKQGKIVSALTTFIEGDMVSFWNGASLPEVRCQGVSTALRRFALQAAVSRGCRIGASYLMSEGMALGICSKLGYEPKWRFNVFFSPSAQSQH